MSKYPYRQDREELRELLQQYNNLKSGKSNSFIEEDSFERLIDYFDEKEQLSLALEASEYAISQYPYSSVLLFKKSRPFNCVAAIQTSIIHFGTGRIAG
ncbi:hypothetical protein [Ferruginibacter sp.]